MLLTPTARLARSHARAFAARMAAEGRLAWLPPKILSFSAWLSELREAYFLSANDARVPIDGSQALVLWQSLIDLEVFIGEPRVAELAQAAWRLIHEHDLQRPAHWPDLLLSEDSARFQDWSASYRSACARQGLVDEWTFAGEIPTLIGDGAIPAPATLELAGFDMPLSPLQQRILAALEAAGTRISRAAVPVTAATPEVVALVEPDDELLAAARWARARLAARPEQTIAVVVPDLGGRLARVESLFRQVFDPAGFALSDAGPDAWHISLGRPLAHWPLVSDALAVLELPEQQLTQPVAQTLLRSPFLRGWGDEAPARNAALARLTRDAPYDVTLNELQWLLSQAGAQTLADRLTALQAGRADTRGTAWPSGWVARFQQELSNAGFGEGRPLDSREYQVLQRWHDLLEAFSALDIVSSAPITRSRALALLRERAQAAVFREQDPGVPVEVLGVEEALGSRFDAVWLTTLDGDTWPGPARRDPLIPASLQSGIAGATSAGALEQARRELAGLLATAPLIRGSFSTGSAEEARELTTLLAGARLDVPEPAAPAAALAPMAPPLQDDQAPPLLETSARGGTGLLSNQSACPFRAFAERRLGARDLRVRRPGLDAAQRGNVIHKALERFWHDVPDQSALAALAATPTALQARIATAVDAAITEFADRYRLTLTPAGRRLEQRRTARVVDKWLAIELKRGDFTVQAHEQPISLALAGLTLSGKIDRIDRFPDGSTLLIDYKTGRNARSGWFPEPRIADPQLPAYAVAMNPQPSGIAFARIRPEELKFDGLAAVSLGTEGIESLARVHGKFRDIEDWDALLQLWQTHLEGLARDFQAGQAAVDPRKRAVCDNCHLHALCRIRERAPFAALDEDVLDE